MPRSVGPPSYGRSPAVPRSPAGFRPAAVSLAPTFLPNDTRRSPLRWRMWPNDRRYRPSLRSCSPSGAAAEPVPQPHAVRHDLPSPARYRGPTVDQSTARVAALAANQLEPYKRYSSFSLLLIAFFCIPGAWLVSWAEPGHEFLHRIKPLHIRQTTALQLADLAFICCHHQHIRISLSLPDVEAKRHLKKAFDVDPFAGSQADDPLRVLVLCVCHR